MSRKLLERPRFFATIFAAILIALSGSAGALWLQSAEAPKLDSKPFVVSLDGLMTPPPAPSFLVRLDVLIPPRRDDDHGLFALPPLDASGPPRLRAQYRADFPVSITLETDGALTGDAIAPTGAMNLMARVVFTRHWWTPQLTTSFTDFRMDQLPNGRVEYSEARLRGEWKLRF